MSRIYEIAHDYVDQLADIDPSTATALGLPGHEREMPDYSPEGYGRIAHLNLLTRADLADAEPEDERDRIAKEMISERLSVFREMYDNGEQFRALRIIGSPLQRCRSIFDDMPKTTE